MENIINFKQKVKEKESKTEAARHLELLNKALSNLSIDEQLEFKKYYDEREKSIADLFNLSKEMNGFMETFLKKE